MSAEIRITNLEELKSASIPIKGPIPTYYFMDDLEPSKRIGRFDPTYDLEEVHHCFREIEGVIAFIDEEEVLYAIPACRTVRDILKEGNFIPDDFMRVPFIRWDGPLHDLEKWSNLLEWKHKEDASEILPTIS